MPFVDTFLEKVEDEKTEEDKAEELAEGKGAVAVNIMSVTQLYGDYVKTAVEEGVDAIISGGHQGYLIAQ